MGLLIQKLRDSARGQRCQFQIAGICNHNPETTVLCHAPSEVKGTGNKGHDYNAAFGCCACHEALDQRKLSEADAAFYWLRACQRTLDIWIDAKLITLPVDPDKAPTRPRRKSKWPKREMRSRNDLSRAQPKKVP